MERQLQKTFIWIAVGLLLIGLFGNIGYDLKARGQVKRDATSLVQALNDPEVKTWLDWCRADPDTLKVLEELYQRSADRPYVFSECTIVRISQRVVALVDLPLKGRAGESTSLSLLLREDVGTGKEKKDSRWVPVTVFAAGAHYSEKSKRLKTIERQELQKRSKAGEDD